MKTKQELALEGQKLLAQYKAIQAEFEGKEIPADKAAELDRIATQADEIKDKLESAKATEEREKDMAALSDYFQKPAVKVPFSANGADSDGREALARAGWTVKSGTIYAETSKGPVAVFPEHVLFGKMPTDPFSARYVKAIRASFQPEYEAAFVAYVRGAAGLRSEGQAFVNLSGREQAALSEGVDSAGGYLVPAQRMPELLARRAAAAVMRRYARVIQTSSDLAQWPRVQAHATSGSIYSSAFVGDWVGETPAFTEVDPAFGLFQIPVRKARAASKQSNDLLSDAQFDILAFLATDGGRNLGLVEDSGFIDGDGSALKPKGILRSGATETDVSGTTADQISNTTADTGSAPKLVDWVYTLPDQYLEGAVVLLRRANEGRIRKLVDADGRFLWPETGFGATPKDLFGYPKATSPFMPDGGTDGNRVGLFGSISDAYIIAERNAISVAVLRERFADTDQTGFVLFSRVGGDTHNADAIRIAKV